MNPPALLDPIITSLGNYYQTPECVQPLGPDAGSLVVESDHKIVLMKPVNFEDQICSRTFREVSVRPITESGMLKLAEWFKVQNWADIIDASCVNEKAELLKWCAKKSK